MLKKIAIISICILICLSDLSWAETTQTQKPDKMNINFALKDEPDLPNFAWQQLLNTDNMQEWGHVGQGKFYIENDLLRTEGNMGLLWYKQKKIGNCILRVIYKTNSDQANSGVFVRIAKQPTDAWYAVHNGYEIQISDKGKDAYDEYHKTGSIYSLAPAKQPIPSYPVGEWNTLDIFLVNNYIYVYLNGIKVSSFSPDQKVPIQKKKTEPSRLPIRPILGYIGLQNHDEVPGVHVWFKEVAIMPFPIHSSS